MKVLGWKAVLVLVLSLACWCTLYVAFPTTPPDAAETSVIVGMVLALVLGTSSILARFSKEPATAATATADAPAEESAS